MANAVADATSLVGAALRRGGGLTPSGQGKAEVEMTTRPGWSSSSFRPGVERPFALMLDSASLADAEAAAELGFVSGITTNPTSIAGEGSPPLEVLGGLLRSFAGPIFYQPSESEVEGAEQELDRALQMDAQRVLSKLPARLDFVTLATRYVRQGHDVALTAVYAPGQALLATAAGAEWVIPYVNTMSRDITRCPCQTPVDA
jgi:hypothetical protein